MAYTNISDVRALSKITEANVGDDDMSIIIRNSSYDVNTIINSVVIREQVLYIDDVRDNDIDGVNDTFYVSNWNGRFLADYNNDGDVDTNDIIVYQVLGSEDPVETVLTVTSIDYEKGQFVLSAAPDELAELYVTYAHSAFDPVTPDGNVYLAATYLSIANSYLKKDVGIPANIKFSSFSISRKLSNSYGVWLDKYDLVKSELIKSTSSAGAISECVFKI